MQEVQKEIIQASRWVIILRAVTHILSLWTYFILLQVLSHSDYGSYNLILSTGIIAGFLFSMGIGQAISRYVPEFIAKENHKSIRELIVIFTSVRFIALLISLPVLFFAKDIISNGFGLDGEIAKFYWIIILMIYLTLLCSVFGADFHAAALHYKPIIIHEMIKKGVFLGVIYYNRHEANLLYIIVWAMVLLNCFSLIYYFISASRITKYLKNKYSESTEVNGVNWRRVGKYSAFYMLATTGAVFFDFSVDSWVIAGFYKDSGPVAIYGFAAVLLTAVGQISPMFFFKGFFEHIIVRRYSENEDKKILTQGTALVSVICTFVSLPMLMWITFNTKNVIQLFFSEEYVRSIPIIHVLVAMFVVRFITAGFGFSISVLELAKYRFYSVIFSIYNLISSIILIKYFGLNGVAIATATAGVMTNVYLGYVIKKYGKADLGIDPVKIIKISAIALISVLASKFVFGQSDQVASLFLSILLTTIVYSVISYIWKPFEEEQRDLINSYLGRKIWVF